MYALASHSVDIYSHSIVTSPDRLPKAIRPDTSENAQRVRSSMKHSKKGQQNLCRQAEKSPRRSYDVTS